MQSEDELRRTLRNNLNLHIGDQTARYILSRLAQGARAFPVFAADARTGQPLHRQLDAASLVRAEPTLFDAH